ncbi:DoxX family protein [Nocardiopsis sp. RSe5-2]|uniref:DoxX family protein n=1 Tax=Nocardiopsis endophytica TaxID=3018445 RepID=A0ABT4U6W6_9ACTN|nr:DoxX family protein [Nocardiopsis endophytica]MDA2812209.1 DoxX family protein [Nocardiopsis endophytica]
MHTVYLVVVWATILANAGIAVADFARAGFVMDNSAAVGLPPSWIMPLGVLKTAGALGLLAGVAGFRWIGAAAAAGLVLFFIGAVAAHVRARVFSNIAFPGAYLALAAGSLVLTLLR